MFIQESERNHISRKVISQTLSQKVREHENMKQMFIHNTILTHRNKDLLPVYKDPNTLRRECWT